MVGECQRRTNGRRRTSAAAVNRSERIPHEAELGAFLGAHVSSPAGLPGLACADGVLFEYGDIETSSRLQRDGERYVVIDRDRAREQRAAEFSHLEDAERFLAIRDGRGRTPGKWSAGRAIAPDDVEVTSGDGAHEFSWLEGSEEHVVRAFGVPEASTAYRLCWVRALPFARVFEVVSSPGPLALLREMRLVP